MLIYSYANGTFSSRKIKRLTYENVAVRLLCADTHPDHDSICKFRRENRALVESSFHQVLECSARSRVLQVGEAVDGTKIWAHASKHSAVIIKEAMGLRRFSLRGLAKVGLEWTLVSLSCNLKRLFHLGAQLRPPEHTPPEQILLRSMEKITPPQPLRFTANISPTGC